MLTPLDFSDAEHPEEDCTSLLRQARRGLVEDQDAGVDTERPGDGDERLFRPRQVADPAIADRCHGRSSTATGAPRLDPAPIDEAARTG